MNKKTIHKINGGIAIYYGIGSLILAISGVIVLIGWLYKVLAGQATFSWGTPVVLTIMIALFGAIGYSILRVGYEEIEK